MEKLDFFRRIYEITDEIIVDCGITEHIADIYLACPADFLTEEKEWEAIRKKWKIDLRFEWTDPLALIALNILENETN